MAAFSISTSDGTAKRSVARRSISFICCAVRIFIRLTTSQQRAKYALVPFGSISLQVLQGVDVVAGRHQRDTAVRRPNAIERGGQYLAGAPVHCGEDRHVEGDRKSTRLNS